MDLWDSFVGKDEMYERGGLHLNPFVRIYIYVRNPKTVATPAHIYTYTDLGRKHGAFTGVN